MISEADYAEAQETIRSLRADLEEVTRKKVGAERRLETRIDKMTTIERVARLIWMMEDGSDHAWTQYIDKYRSRARLAVENGNGYVMAAEPINPPDPEE